MIEKMLIGMLNRKSNLQIKSLCSDNKDMIIGQLISMQLTNEPLHEKMNNLVRHKRVCTVSEEGQKLEILDLASRGTVLSLKGKQRH